jgi:toxin HigB-1
VTRYNALVIRTFADRATEELYVSGRARRLPPDIVRRARRRLEYIDLATCLDDLKTPPGNRLHQLAGDRAGQYAVAINDQWRVCFAFDGADAYDVEITDYH